VIDAGALTGLRDCAAVTGRLQGRLVVTPHAGEMARLSGLDKDEVLAHPLDVARSVADHLQAVVALKGPETLIVTPSGEAFRYRGGGIGLATSGSGDVLAGVIGGLLARGANPLTATAWGVCVHGEAGADLARDIGPVGFLARELLDLVPRILACADPGS
jgi:NAD(P)H-hydrate repair Nnr-like enzyme with NAD(P)H-hydrate dehydratase domain